MEFYIDEKDFELTKRIFHELPLNAKFSEEPQQRINYLYKGREIALKHGKIWGYHLEIEKLLENKEPQEATEVEIRSVANELEISLMSDEELKRFVQDHESKLPYSECLQKNLKR